MTEQPPLDLFRQIISATTGGLLGAGGGGTEQASSTGVQQTTNAPWTGNNIFRNATQGMGLNEGIYGNLLQTLSGQQNDPYGRPIPSSYTPPTALTGPVATYGGYGGGTNPTAPTNGGTTPTTGGTGGTGGGNGDGAGLGGSDAGGSSERDIDREGGYAAAAGTYDGSLADLMGALGISGDFSGFGDTSLSSLFGGNSNLLGYDAVTPELAALGTLLGGITGLPLGTLGTLGGSYVDQQNAIDSITQLNDPYGTGSYTADVGYLDGLLNNISFGLLGTSYEDQALQDSLSQLQNVTMDDLVTNLYGPSGVLDSQAAAPSLNETYQNSLRDQIASLESQLATKDPDTAGYQSIQRQINELQGQLDSGGAYSSSTMDMLGNIADNARDPSTAVGADRERDQSTGDAASQSGPR